MPAAGSSLRHIVPIPYSCGFETAAEGQAEPRLSVFSQVVVDACVRLMQEQTKMPGNELPDIILAAETPLPEGYPTTAELMTQSLLTQNIPFERIINLDQTRSPDKPMNWTTRQIGAVAAFTQDIANLTPDAIRLVPLDYHLPRVARHAAAFGLRASIESAETILGADGIKPYEQALQLLSSVIPSERVLRLFACFDGRGHLIEFLDKFRGECGSRILDVVDGKLVKKTSSKRFFAQLQGPHNETAKTSYPWI